MYALDDGQLLGVLPVVHGFKDSALRGRCQEREEVALKADNDAQYIMRLSR
jgi:hypothetical protein